MAGWLVTCAWCRDHNHFHRSDGSLLPLTLSLARPRGKGDVPGTPMDEAFRMGRNPADSGVSVVKEEPGGFNIPKAVARCFCSAVCSMLTSQKIGRGKTSPCFPLRMKDVP